MAVVLANYNVKNSKIELTENKEPKLVISFGLKLENGYDFKKLKSDSLKEFQTILNDSTQLSLDEMENRYGRDLDSDDILEYNGIKFQVLHFGKDRSTFRIHGILADSYFHVIRIDPKHKFHKK